jgi:hypothetical protein
MNAYWVDLALPYQPMRPYPFTADNEAEARVTAARLVAEEAGDCYPHDVFLVGDGDLTLLGHVYAGVAS